MDQPLDLSQREMERQSVESYNIRAPQDEYYLQHARELEARNVRSSQPPYGHYTTVMTARTAAPYVAPYYSEYDMMERFSDQTNKRSSFSDTRTNSLQHTKRRKTELFSDSIYKAASENNLYNYVSGRSHINAVDTTNIYEQGDISATPMSRSPDSSDFSRVLHTVSPESYGYTRVNEANSPEPNNFIRSSENYSSISPTARSDGSGSSQMDDNSRTPAIRSCCSSPVRSRRTSGESNKGASDALKEVNKSIEYMERIPKKRFAARNLSLESNRSAKINANSLSGGEPFIHKDMTNGLTCAVSESCLNGNGSDSSTSTSSTPSLENTPENCSPAKPPVDFNTLKADMIREIEDEKQRETRGEADPINQQFNSFLYNTKSGGELSSTYGRMRLAAVEYLLSKTLGRHNHSPTHNVIMGEKPGKLSLMDMVELQVEIGLA